MDIDESRVRLMRIVALAGEYCAAVETAAQFEKEEFVRRMLDCLPRIYWEFNDLTAGEAGGEIFMPQYVDEDYYDSVRRAMETLFGTDDSYLETFEEDMKYSDTPIAASIAEGLADMFQPLYNFVHTVRDSDGEQLYEAFEACKEDFESYWSQTLCNVLRALNNIRRR